MKNLLICTSCIFILLFGSSAYAKLSFVEEVQQLNKDYLVCNNLYTNTGSLTVYQRCLESNYNGYDILIKKIREKNGFKNKDKWNLINNKINAHNLLCKENLEKSPNISIHKEVSLCNQFMYKSLATEAINIK